MPGPAGTPLTTLATVRRALLAIIAFGTIGMATELVLTGHYEDPLQLAPLVAAAFALLAVAWVAVRPSIAGVRTLQFVMLSFIGTGITGMTVHYVANAEFQRELDPALSGLPLFWKVVEATAPPALAPGVLVQLGLLGLLYTYKHPVLAEEPFDASSKETI
jgi:hypothetical protein